MLRVLEQNGIEAVGAYHSRPINGTMSLDVRDPDAVELCFETVKPDTVFLAVITRGGADYCEDHPDEVRELNVTGTRNVVMAAARCKAKIVYYSTDYIFDGKSGPYSEEDRPCPISVYGRMKWEAEQIIQEISPSYLILRTTVVFGWDRASKNFAMQVWETLQAGKPMRVPNDQWGNPTFVDCLAEAT